MSPPVADAPAANRQQSPTDSAQATRRTQRRLRRVLSFTCPGLGQCVAGRWLAGATQFALFMGCSVFIIWHTLSGLVRLYREALRISDNPGAELTLAPLPVAGLLIALAAALLVWLWSIWDAGK